MISRTAVIRRAVAASGNGAGLADSVSAIPNIAGSTLIAIARTAAFTASNLAINQRIEAARAGGTAYSTTRTDANAILANLAASRAVNLITPIIIWINVANRSGLTFLHPGAIASGRFGQTAFVITAINRALAGCRENENNNPEKYYKYGVFYFHKGT